MRTIESRYKMSRKSQRRFFDKRDTANCYAIKPQYIEKYAKSLNIWSDSLPTTVTDIQSNIRHSM